MSNPNQLPPSRAALSAVGNGKQSEILPKHKAIILYWMLNADEASKDPANADSEDEINHFAPVIVQDLYYSEHIILLSTPSIVNHYHNAQKNAIDFGLDLGYPLDVWTVANIIESQVNDQETYTEVSTFLENYKKCRPTTVGTRPLLVFKAESFPRSSSFFCAVNSKLQNTDLTPQSRKGMAIVLDPVRRTSKMLRDRWNEADSSGLMLAINHLRSMMCFRCVVE